MAAGESPQDKGKPRETERRGKKPGARSLAACFTIVSPFYAVLLCVLTWSIYGLECQNTVIRYVFFPFHVLMSRKMYFWK